MSQDQRPRRADQAAGDQEEEKAVRYGDVFPGVSGELASQAIPPRDAAMMQAAETQVLGKTQRGGPAAMMQSTADVNERVGAVDHGEITSVAADEGVTVAKTYVPGGRIVAEAVGGQVIGQYAQPVPDPTNPESYIPLHDSITIGDALEATAITVGDKAVDKCDAAAIQAAETRAAGGLVYTPAASINIVAAGTATSVGAEAQSAAAWNARTAREQDKTKLSDVLTGASSKLPSDKVATPEDAEAVIGAEMRNNPNRGTYSGGVAASVAAAARLNQRSA